jgi:hypothetical protein
MGAEAASGNRRRNACANISEAASRNRSRSACVSATERRRHVSARECSLSEAIMTNTLVLALCTPTVPRHKSLIQRATLYSHAFGMSTIQLSQFVHKTLHPIMSSAHFPFTSPATIKNVTIDAYCIFRIEVQDRTVITATNSMAGTIAQENSSTAAYSSRSKQGGSRERRDQFNYYCKKGD